MLRWWHSIGVGGKLAGLNRRWDSPFAPLLGLGRIRRGSPG